MTNQETSHVRQSTDSSHPWETLEMKVARLEREVKKADSNGFWLSMMLLAVVITFSWAIGSLRDQVKALQTAPETQTAPKE